MPDENSMPIIPQLPHADHEAEKAVLGCMLIEGESGTRGIMNALSLLTEEDFYEKKHQLIFKAISDLYSRSEAINLISVKNAIDAMGAGILDSCGGTPYIVELVGYMSTSANIMQFAGVVKEKSKLRKLVKLSNSITDNNFVAGKTSSELISIIESTIEGLTNEAQGDFINVNDGITRAIEQIEKAAATNKRVTGISTGFTDFDNITAGLHNSDLILIAARPAMGKTAFALNIAQHAAINEKVTTALFSLEMSDVQLTTRMLCSIGLIDSSKVRTGNLDNEDWEKLVAAIGDLSDSPLYIYDSSFVTPMDIRAKCAKLKKEKNLGLIVIDYLQLMSGNRKTDSRQQEVSEISRSLKNIARELDVPVIALSQLSRSVESRPNHRPILSDLRESGAIEQDADIVCFLYRDDYYTKEECENPGIAEVMIEKHRNGDLGTVKLRWRGEFTRFFTLETQYQ